MLADYSESHRVSADLIRHCTGKKAKDALQSLESGCGSSPAFLLWDYLYFEGERLLLWSVLCTAHWSRWCCTSHTPTGSQKEEEKGPLMQILSPVLLLRKKNRKRALIEAAWQGNIWGMPKGRQLHSPRNASRIGKERLLSKNKQTKKVCKKW